MPYDSVIDDAARANGLDPAMMRRISQIESGGDPTNQTGSYKGLFQLSDSEFGKYGGGDIYDPAANSNAAARKLAAETAAFKSKYGRDPSATDIYLTHQQGEGGYGAHMSNPDAPAWENMQGTAEGRQKGDRWAKQAIWGNIPDDVKRLFPGGVETVTSKAFRDIWDRKVNGGSFDASPMASAFAAEGTRNMNPIEAALAQARAKLQGFTPQQGEDPGILSSLAQQYAPAAAPYVPSADTFDKLALAGSMLRDNPGATAAGVAAYKAKQGNGDIQTIAHGDNLIQIHRPTGKVLGMTKLPTEGKLVTSTNEDILGNKTQRHDIFKDGVLAPAQTAGAPGGAVGGDNGSGTGPDMSPVLAPGVKFDDSLTGDDRLKQYKPEYQAAIKAYVNGESMPTSSRVGKAATWIKQQAQRYGQDTGTLVDDNTFNAKRKVLTELGAGSFGSLGGQLTAAKTYLGHLGEGVDAFNKLGNYDNSDNLIGMIPGSAMGTHVINAFGNSKANTAPFVKAVNEVADKAGAEGIKLYAGARGGVDERKEAKTIFDTSQQPAEMKERVTAATKLANDKIDQLLGQAEGALGKDHPRVVALRQELEDARTKLNDKLTFGQYMKK